MAADRTGDQNFVPTLYVLDRQEVTAQGFSDTCGIHENTASLAGGDDFGVAADHPDPGLIGGSSYRFQHPLEIGGGKAFFQDKTHREVAGSSPAYGQIVTGAENAQCADVPAWKEGGIHDVGVCGDKHPALDLEGGGIGQFPVRFILQNGIDQLFCKLSGQGAAAAVLQRDAIGGAHSTASP